MVRINYFGDVLNCVVFLVMRRIPTRHSDFHLLADFHDILNRPTFRV